MYTKIPGLDRIESNLEKLQVRKDKVEAVARQAIRLAGTSITLMHAKDPKAARKSLAELDRSMVQLRKIEKGLEYYSLPAHQEYVEALALYILINEKRIISISETKSGEAAYLLGIMDVVGELKREVIEAIRAGDMAYANECYENIKTIYDSTRAMRFSNSLVPDFRRKQDTARIQLENAASELINFNRHVAELESSQ